MESIYFWKIIAAIAVTVASTMAIITIVLARIAIQRVFSSRKSRRAFSFSFSRSQN
jgi:hypothetical protein